MMTGDIKSRAQLMAQLSRSQSQWELEASESVR